MNVHYADYNLDLRSQKIQCNSDYNNYNAQVMIKYYADSGGNSNGMCLTEPTENDQTFPSLFLPLLAVKKVKNIEVTSISSKYLRALKPLH